MPQSTTTKSIKDILSEIKTAKAQFNQEIKKIDREQSIILERFMSRVNQQKINNITNHLTSSD